ncbi:MAG: hypothetical protein P8M30_07805 [Planctomycetaceae bacterium]|jgi:hypothetical protein|nr:hypothetical protein [Planctomycetaceae bacterium]
MNRPGMFLLALCCLVGCGSEELADVSRVESQLTVIDFTGKEQQISSSELIDPDTGKPTVQKVLVIDRQKKKKGFVDASELQSQSPSAPRYFPVTTEAPSKG